MRSRPLVTVLLMGLATLVVGAAVAAPAAGTLGGASSVAGAGSLELHAALNMVSRRAAAGDCPPGTPSTIECHPREGKAVVPGLGSVSESYLYRVDTAPAGCPAGSFKVLSTTGRFTVAGKGEIQLAVGESPDCHTLENVLAPTRSFTITGGSGTFAGASGSGTLDQTATFTSTGAAGTDTWVGSLAVPGLEFDVTPPTLSGAVGKTVRAPRGATRARHLQDHRARRDRRRGSRVMPAEVGQPFHDRTHAR